MLVASAIASAEKAGLNGLVRVLAVVRIRIAATCFATWTGVKTFVRTSARRARTSRTGDGASAGMVVAVTRLRLVQRQEDNGQDDQNLQHFSKASILRWCFMLRFHRVRRTFALYIAAEAMKNVESAARVAVNDCTLLLLETTIYRTWPRKKVRRRLYVANGSTLVFTVYWNIRRRTEAIYSNSKLIHGNIWILSGHSTILPTPNSIPFNHHQSFRAPIIKSCRNKSYDLATCISSLHIPIQICKGFGNCRATSEKKKQ